MTYQRQRVRRSIMYPPNIKRTGRWQYYGVNGTTNNAELKYSPTCYISQYQWCAFYFSMDRTNEIITLKQYETNTTFYVILRLKDNNKAKNN